MSAKMVNVNLLFVVDVDILLENIMLLTPMFIFVKIV